MTCEEGAKKPNKQSMWFMEILDVKEQKMKEKKAKKMDALFVREKLQILFGMLSFFCFDWKKKKKKCDQNPLWPVSKWEQLPESHTARGNEDSSAMIFPFHFLFLSRAEQMLTTFIIVGIQTQVQRL